MPMFGQTCRHVFDTILGGVCLLPAIGLRFVPLVVVGLFDTLEDHFAVGYAVG